MSLSDLSKHTSVQEEVINEIPPEALPNTHRRVWIDFREDLWGKNLGPFQVMKPFGESGSGPFYPVVMVPEVIVNVWGLQHRQIFVRSEYNRAEEEALSIIEHPINVVVVKGEPGIGTSPSLRAPCRT
jgi:hypothetical protein